MEVKDPGNEVVSSIAGCPFTKNSFRAKIRRGLTTLAFFVYGEMTLKRSKTLSWDTGPFAEFLSRFANAFSQFATARFVDIIARFFLCDRAIFRRICL